MNWDEDYPDKQILKHEVQAMRDALLEALLEAIPADAIAGIYFKGSALKNWDSPLDYVPELSDIDIHLLLENEAAIAQYLELEQALKIQANIERLYQLKIPKPLHIPRPQLVVLNHLLDNENFVPSPNNTTSIIYGKPYPFRQPTQGKIRQIDRKNLLEPESFISELPLSVVDKPSKYLWSSLRALNWRVSPTGSRVLSVLGLPFEKAWGINRTGIIEQLRTIGKNDLAAEYEAFYLNSWTYFLSGYENGKAGRSAIAAGFRLLKQGIKIAKFMYD